MRKFPRPYQSEAPRIQNDSKLLSSCHQCLIRRQLDCRNGLAVRDGGFNGNGIASGRTMACCIRRGLLLAEVTVCLATAVAFGYAYPDRYRTRLWENGGAEGWNSSPGLEVEVPLIWSQRYVSVLIMSLFQDNRLNSSPSLTYSNSFPLLAMLDTKLTFWWRAEGVPSSPLSSSTDLQTRILRKRSSLPPSASSG